MQNLIDLFRHNSWANGKVFDLVAGLDAQVIAGEAPATRSTVTGTLAHLARVEYVYLAMLEQRPWPSVESDAAYRAHDLSWFRSHVQELGAAYLTLLDDQARAGHRPAARGRDTQTQDVGNDPRASRADHGRSTEAAVRP